MEKFTLLLVDDIDTNLFTLRLLIEENFDDINILEALTVKDAVELVMANDVDLILTDVQMPEAGGFDLAKYLKDIDKTKDLPIIMISGIYEDDIHKKLAYHSSKNVIDFITKPIDDELLTSKLKAFMNILNSRKKDKEIIKEYLSQK